MILPRDFVWGCATAAYQIEGAVNEDGKGLSIWDMMTQRGGKVWNNQTGDVACDHYHLYRNDVSIMRDLGLKGYRFSISWPRVLPEGVGRINFKGLDFYDRLVDQLLAVNIQPWVTLYHWDFPLALYWRGGWLKRESADWFADYVAIVAKKLGDRVSNWITHNEPQCAIGLGLRDGIHAPGDQLSTSEWLLAGHHLLLSHGKAVQVLRKTINRPIKVGYAPFSCVSCPATEDAKDVEAARMNTFAVREKNQWNSSWWMDPIFLGQYPKDGLVVFGSSVPRILSDDMAIISQPLDFFGFNFYFSVNVRMGEEGSPAIVPDPPGSPLAAFGGPVTPRGIYWAAKFYYDRYKLPLVVTESGMACCDWVALDGKIHDPQRIDYLRRYLKEVCRAVRDGIPINGYFLWTLMDNFEWQEGFKQRLGIIYVDFATQQRIWKDSAFWYSDVIGCNGETL